jgi:hypothetical protein
VLNDREPNKGVVQVDTAEVIQHQAAEWEVDIEEAEEEEDEGRVVHLQDLQRRPNLSNSGGK